MELPSLNAHITARGHAPGPWAPYAEKNVLGVATGRDAIRCECTRCHGQAVYLPDNGDYYGYMTERQCRKAPKAAKRPAGGGLPAEWGEKLDVALEAVLSVQRSLPATCVARAHLTDARDALERARGSLPMAP